MHCISCGAPLETIDHLGNFRCRFCDTLHPTNGESTSKQGEQTADRIVIMDQLVEDATCPRCDVGLSLGMLDGHKIATCTKCHGALMARVDFARVVRSRRANFSGADSAVTPMNPEELRVAAQCPACGKRMETFPYYGPGAVVIDLCHHCDYLWCDSGELTRIEIAPGQR